MNLFRLLTRTSGKTVTLAILAGMVSGISTAGLLALIHQTLAHSDPDAARFDAGPVRFLACVFAGLCVVVLVSKLISQSLLIRLSQQAITRMCQRLSERILAASLRHLEELGAARLLAALTGDVVTVVQALQVLPALCVNLVLVVCCLVYIAWLSPLVFTAAAVLLVLGVGLYRVLIQRAFRYLRLVREEQDRLFVHFRGLIEGAKELKVHRPRRAAFLEQALLPSLRAVEQLGTVGLQRFSSAVNWSRMLFLLLLGFLLFVVPGVVAVTPATVAGYTLAVLFAMSPLEGVLGALPLVGRARIALDKVEKLGLSLEEHRGDEDKEEFSSPSTWQQVELAGVEHAYHNEREGRGFLLGPINLSLRPGELLFLVGGNGSGKTTLVKLLVGLYLPEAGEVRLDGRLIGTTEREAYRQLFTVVFADGWLFDTLLGLGSADLDEKAREYLARLHLDRFVQVKDGTFSTTELSTGQRKRLSLVTAYLEDRPIYVFDEWAAAQDPQFKEVFYRQLLPELKARGKAVVVVTHDDRYFGVADRIVRLTDGKMAEVAIPPEEVRNRHGLLAGMPPP